MSKFIRHTKKKWADLWAIHLPNDLMWLNKFNEGTNLRNYLLVNSKELTRVEDAIITFVDQYDPSVTTDFIEEWESVLGIPDKCIPIADTISERRDFILLKLAGLFAQTKDDFQNIAEKLGFNVTISHIADDAFPPYSVPFFPTSSPPDKFTWVVTGEDLVGGLPPYDVPFIPIDGSNSSILQCFFNILKQANTRVVFNNA